MKKYISYVAFLAALWTSLPNARGQEFLVDYTFLGTRSKFELLILFGQVVDYDINLYRIRYKTLDVHNVPDTASGLLVLPIVPANTPLPIVIYGHGTTTGPTDVPSQLRGGFEAVMAYAAKGFATAAPDYLGLGDARGFHPYIHANSEASASFDMLNATVEYLELHDPNWDQEHLFLTGYSQGGHASAAFHKYLQDYFSLVYPVTAAAHMSGPYSVSGVMRDLILSDQSYGTPAYIAYIALGFQEAYGNVYNTIPDFFKDPYATPITNFRNGSIGLTTLNTTLVNLLNQSGGNTIAKRMLQDSVVTRMINDPSYPVNLDLIDNDRYNWSPESPTRLYYCGGDTQVPFENSIVADSAMNALGAPDAHAVNLGNGLDHGPCALPAITNSITYFQSFLTASAVLDFDKHAASVEVLPNPATDKLLINWEAADDGLEYLIVNTNGQIVSKGTSHSNQVDVRTLTNGLYMILISANHQTRIARFLHL